MVCSLHLIPAHLVTKNPKILLNPIPQTKPIKWFFDETPYVTVDFDRHNALTKSIKCMGQKF